MEYRTLVGHGVSLFHPVHLASDRLRGGFLILVCLTIPANPINPFWTSETFVGWLHYPSGTKS